VLGDYVEATVHNEARSGRSTKSYVNENNNYKTILKGLKPGDLFFIQFGHNDENSSSKLHTDPYGATDQEGSYKWYLAEKYIEPALAAGAYPILCTPVVRYLVSDGTLETQSLQAYADAMKELAAEYEEKGITIPVIDCQEYTRQLYTADLEEAASYHALVKSSTGEETLDTTHYCEKGARNLACYILESCRSQLSEIRFSVDSLKIYQGRTKTLPVPIYRSVYFIPLKEETGTWESSDPQVAAIDTESGKLVGISEGETTITYSVGAIQGSFQVRVAPTPVLSLGDVDGSGTITPEDALMVLKVVVGEKEEDFWPEVADCNGSGTITSDDALYILRWVVGNSNPNS
jgi:lysophospholipase L1-like esterase